MDKITLEKPIYQGIKTIWKADRWRPFSENIVNEASVKYGLNQDAARKRLEFLVESGAVYIELTTNEEEE